MPTIEELFALVQQLQQQVAEQSKIITEQSEIIAVQAARIAAQDKIIAEQQALIEHLQDANRRLLRWRFGQRTEKMAEGQCLLALEGLTCPIDPLGAETDADAPVTTVTVRRKKRGGKIIWSALCPHLPLDEQRIELPADQRFDHDGTVLVPHGHETREELVYSPGFCRIKRTIRLRYGRSDTGAKIKTAPNPDRIAPRSGLADETIIASVVHVADDCLPLNRQCEMIRRLGAPVSRSSLTRGFHAWCDLAAPLLEVIHADLMRAEALHIDGSFLFRQERGKKRRCKRSPIYAISDGQQLLLRWRPDESHSAAADLLCGYTGYLIRDEWKGWYGLTDAAVTHVACHAHARRYFAETMEDDLDSQRMVALYGQLYHIERQAAASGLTGDALIAHRYQLRQRHSIAIIDAIEAHAQSIIERRTGKITTKARYILTHRDRLRIFLDHGQLPPDNNLAERALRRNALLRKNRPFFVANDGGQHLATALSLTGSCRLLNINPLVYLQAALPILFAYRQAQRNDTALPDLATWTPAAWAARQPQHTQATTEQSA